MMSLSSDDRSDSRGVPTLAFLEGEELADVSDCSCTAEASLEEESAGESALS